MVPTQNSARCPPHSSPNTKTAPNANVHHAPWKREAGHRDKEWLFPGRPEDSLLCKRCSCYFITSLVCAPRGGNLGLHRCDHWGSPGIPHKPTYALSPNFYDSDSNA